MILAAAAGALSVVAQGILVRELAVLFRNNEVVIGILLGAWLAGSGMGAAGLRLLPRGLRWRPALLLLGQVLAVLVDVLAARWLYGVWQFHARPPLPVAGGVAFALVAPAGACAGLVFASLAVYRHGPLPSAIYVAEAAGACVGGLSLWALLAAGWYAVDVALASMFVALAFLIAAGQPRSPRRIAVSLAVPALALYLCLPLMRAADEAARRLQYRKTPLVISRESRWGHLALVGDPGSDAHYYNGEVVVRRDPVAEEEEALVPVLARGLPSSVLVLGFCPDVLVSGWQRLGVRRITAVFQDETLTLFSDYGAMRRPGYSFAIRFADPFRWRPVVRDRYSLVVVREPLPATIAANRFYARSFYEGLRDALEPGGLLAFAVPYEENGLDSGTARALAVVRRTLGAVWPSVAVVPAGRCWFLASDSPVPVGVADARRRLRSLRPPGRFVNDAWVRHYFSAERRARFAASLDAAGPAPVNRLFDMALFRGVMRHWLRRDLGRAGGLLLAVLAAAAFAAAVYGRRAIVRHRGAAWIAAAGFAAMAGEFLLLLWYQGTTGVVYEHFGPLVGLFMLGMAVGGRHGLVRARRGGAFLGGWVAAVGLLFLVPAPPAGTAVTVAAFALNAAGGAALGAVFTAAARARERAGAGGESVSFLYAADLAGSAIAAVAVPALLVPVIGLPGTAAAALAVLAAGRALVGGNTPA